MRARPSLVAGFLGSSLVFLGAACGGSTQSSDGWAAEFCRAAGTWDDALTSAQETVADKPRRLAIAGATEDVRRATNAFVSHVQELGLPDVDAADRISRELADLAGGLDADIVAIEQTVNEPVFSDETAAATFGTSVAFMGHLLDATIGRMVTVGPERDFAEAFGDARPCRALDRSLD